MHDSALRLAALGLVAAAPGRNPGCGPARRAPVLRRGSGRGAARARRRVRRPEPGTRPRGTEGPRTVDDRSRSAVVRCVIAEHSSRWSGQKCTERWLPRPAARLTFAEAIASRGAINLRSSVLGAVGTLLDVDDCVGERLTCLAMSR